MKTVLQTVSTAEELLVLLNSVTFDDYGQLRFQGIPFLFFYFETPSESDGYSEACYYPSSHTGGYDVYVLRGVPKGHEKRLLFHEIYEASLYSQGVSLDEAHRRTFLEEVKTFGPRQSERACA